MTNHHLAYYRVQCCRYYGKNKFSPFCKIQSYYVVLRGEIGVYPNKGLLKGHKGLLFKDDWIIMFWYVLWSIYCCYMSLFKAYIKGSNKSLQKFLNWQKFYHYIKNHRWIIVFILNWNHLTTLLDCASTNENKLADHFIWGCIYKDIKLSMMLLTILPL